MGEIDEAGQITHCEWCGVEFDLNTEPKLRTVRAPVRVVKPDPDGEAETHCEWCGAPYPEPHHGGQGGSGV